MAEKLTLRDGATLGPLTPADIVGDHIFISQEYSNDYQSFLYKAGEIILKYDNLIATGGVNFQAVVEGKSNSGDFYPVGYQFNPYQSTEFDRADTVILDPNVFWSDAGVSNIVYVGGRTIGEIHPQQVALPAIWRCCVQITQPSGSTFTSLDLSIYAELFNPQ